MAKEEGGEGGRIEKKREKEAKGEEMGEEERVGLKMVLK